jgi:hypothetical protein
MTDNSNEQAILTSDLKGLPVSENFYLRSKLMGYNSILDIIETPVNVLLSKEDFSYNYLGELVTLLKSHNILHKLQPLPGSSSY